MTESTTTDGSAHLEQTAEAALRTFMREIVPRLAERLSNCPVEWDEQSHWEEGPDGHFRERVTRTRSLFRLIVEEWIQSQPDYGGVIAKLRADPLIAPNIDTMVGTAFQLSRFDAHQFVQSMLYAMLETSEEIQFSSEKFNRKWKDFVELFEAKVLPYKSVAPLPNLDLPFPVRLNDELTLDRLSNDEVTRCYQVGVLRSVFSRFPIIEPAQAVGIRRISTVPKVVDSGGLTAKNIDGEDEGAFGRRPLLRADLVVADVLSALRLFKHSQIRSSGYASWTDNWLASSATTCQVLAHYPFFSGVKIDETEIHQFLELWHLLEAGAKRFEFMIHRFNLAFDRGLLADKIVDLVISAEALFLGEIDEKIRGELNYRCSVRAGKFIDHPKYSQREVFQIMRRAYDVRSTIVHGGKVNSKDHRLPDNDAATLSAFTDAFEELIRLAIRKSLAMKEKATQLRRSEFWESLLFSS